MAVNYSYLVVLLPVMCALFFSKPPFKMHRSIEHIQAPVISLDKALSEGEDKWFYHGYKHINIHLPHSFQHDPALSS